MVGRCECRRRAGDCDVDYGPYNVYVVSAGKVSQLMFFRLQKCPLLFIYAYPIFGCVRRYRQAL